MILQSVFEASTSAGASNNCRYDSSLGLLTKKFVALVEGAQDGVLDLNKAAESLQVSTLSAIKDMLAQVLRDGQAIQMHWQSPVTTSRFHVAAVKISLVQNLQALFIEPTLVICISAVYVQLPRSITTALASVASLIIISALHMKRHNKSLP